jgi:hypothetical protein
MALLAGLGLIGVLVWAFAGGGGKPGAPTAGSPQTYGLLPAAASHRAAATDGAKTSRRAPAASSSARSPGSGLPTPSPTPDQEAGQLTQDEGPAGVCAPGTVVLSVFSAKPSYSGGQDPRFAVYAVSTAAGPCTFDLGPGTLHLQVLSSGRVIWDSGDCARSEDTWTARLSRGVPVLESMTWNRTITLPGCVTLASSVRAGTYQAQASTASVASGMLSFRITG